MIKLTIDSYAEKSTDTALYPPEDALAYLTSGLAGEVGELFEVTFYYPEVRYDSGMREQRLLEAGDVLWYLSQIAVVVLEEDFSSAAVASLKMNPLNEIPSSFEQFETLCSYNDLYDGVNPTPIKHAQHITVHMLYMTTRLSEIVKKAIRDDGGLLRGKRRSAYIAAFGNVCLALASLMRWYKIPLREVAKLNIEKLSQRQKEGTLKDIGRTEQH